LEITTICNRRLLFNIFVLKLVLKIFFSILLFLIPVFRFYGQTDTARQKKDTVADRVYLLQKVERDGVSLPEIQIKDVAVVAKQSSARKSYYRKYDRLVYNLKRVYPYALIVRARIEKVNQELMQITDERDRRRYIKDVEKDVFGEYEDDMKNMTITQGRLLIKLIDRETRNTGFELIKEYRGGLTAAFWQGVARIFGTNLKEEYDPYGEDIIIELIIQDIEAGRI
jgi:hypothetical protein